MWLRGKRSAVLDLATDEGRSDLHHLVRSADVVVASFLPGEAERFGADVKTLQALQPSLIYCRITGWGPVGPYAHYPAYEALTAAKSGRMMTFAGQLKRDGPIFSALPVGIHGTAQAALQGILAALYDRARTGAGRLVETSLLQGMIPMDQNGVITSSLARLSPDLHATLVLPAMDSNRPPTLQYQPVLTKDGRWIQFANLLEHLYAAYIHASELDDIYSHVQFLGAPANLTEAAREELRDIMLNRALEREAAEWTAEFIANGDVASEVVITTQDALRHPDMIANGDVIEFDHPRLGPMRQLGPLAEFTETPATIEGFDPLVGEHTEEVLAEAASRHAPVVASGESTPQLPLAGITVLEFAGIIATPLGVQMLADLGARVIKVEPVGGDPYRGMLYGLGTTKTTAGKESICLDLKSPAGVEVVRKLVAQADMIIHNFRPGVPERLGFGYADVCAIRPDIIWISANGYGPHGPSANRPAAHPLPGALCGGVHWQVGEGMPKADCTSIEEIREVARQISRANEVNPDPNTSLVIASSALMALNARQRTGKGQRVFVNMMGANAYANADDFVSYAGKPPRTEVNPGLNGLSALWRLYESRSGWVFLAVMNDREWAALVATPDFETLGLDARFTSSETRREHDAALVEALGAVFASRDADEWELLLTSSGIGCVRADGMSAGEFWDSDPHALANGFARDAHHARWGDYRRHGPIVRLAGTPDTYGPGCLAGEHTQAILEELGYSEIQRAELTATGIAWSEAG
jgi:crotonobetainyl-CoA:carnitine CoA-transferase CaiB-like acyl-CoA transferase